MHFDVSPARFMFQLYTLTRINFYNITEVSVIQIGRTLDPIGGGEKKRKVW